MHKFTLIIICLLSWIGMKAQEKALLYSHYTFNGLALNPAYAGSHEMLSVNLSHRSQWMGFEGAPSYNIFAAHTPLKKTAMGLGLLVMNESIGLRNYTGFYMNYAHRLNLGSGKVKWMFRACRAMMTFSMQIPAAIYCPILVWECIIIAGIFTLDYRCPCSWVIKPTNREKLQYIMTLINMPGILQPE
jgi:hypothetical protein